MNKYLRYALPMALATLALAGCKDDDNVEVGKWDSSADYAVVSFKEITRSVELDPAEETIYTLHMTRRNPELSDMLGAEEQRIAQLIQDEEDEMEDELDAAEAIKNEALAAEGLTDAEKAEILAKYKKTVEAVKKEHQEQIDILEGQYNEFDSVQCSIYLQPIEVPITITNGTEDIFTISSAKFKKGAWDAEYTISFPKAEIGTTYEVQYAVKDPRFTSAYSDAATATFSVTRVKWVPVGKADFHDWYYFENNNEVEVYMKDGDNTKFRIMHPYDKMLKGAQSAQPSEYTELTLLKVGQTFAGVKITEPDLVYFTGIHTGYVHPDYGAEIVAWHPADLYANPAESQFLSSYVMGYQKKTIEGKEYTIPGAINLAPYFYMSGVGGWNATTEDPGIRIIFDGFKLKYEANLFNDEDFEWEEVYTGEFTSGQIGTTQPVTLYRGKCVATQDDADKTFTANYGVPYVLEAPYAEDYDVYFFVKDGRIQMPKDYDEELGLQPLGIEAAGMPIYASINGSSSSFSENVVKLNMTFQAERKYRDANGRTQTEYITLDTNDEVLANITWSEYATGLCTYSFFSPNEDGSPFTDTEPYTLLKRDDLDNTFKIAEWGRGSDFLFTWDQATNACSVADQDANYAHSTYGAVYLVEGKIYNAEKYGEATSYFDPETKTFHFFPVFYVEAGAFGQTEEIFQLTDDGAAVKHIASRFINTKATPLNVKTGINKLWNMKKLAKPAAGKKADKGNKNVSFSTEKFNVK